MAATAIGQRTRLCIAILAAIEDWHFHQSAEAETVIDAQVGTMELRARAKRHMLVKCPIGCRATLQEGLGRYGGVLRDGARVVVLHLVIVPSRQAGGRGMQRAQIPSRAAVAGCRSCRARRRNRPVCRAAHCLRRQDDRRSCAGPAGARQAVGRQFARLSARPGRIRPARPVRSYRPSRRWAASATVGRA